LRTRAANSRQPALARWLLGRLVLAMTMTAGVAFAQGPVRISLDEAIQLALQHNHTLLAARTTILQSQAEEMTANMRPNPTLLGDAEYLSPSHPTTDYLNNASEFDLGVSYLFERGRKRQHRLQAAKDITAQTRSQVADNERSLTFSVATIRECAAG
jgi:outer membrane protein, heavy metal efflux system